MKQTLEYCQNCGSNLLKWHCTPTNQDGAVDGRICMREVTVLFFLGCEECSETLTIMSGDQVCQLLNQNAPQGPSAPLPLS